MTIFKEKVDEEYLTTAEVKDLLAEVETERAEADDRDLRYELARSLEHVNRYAVLDAEESRELVSDLEEFEKIDTKTAIKIANLLPEDRTELRTVFAKERFALDGEELDEVLNVVAKYV